jgi:hypothetical protein
MPRSFYLSPGASMHKTLGILVALASFACNAEAPTENGGENRLAPPTLSFSAASRPISNASGGQDLEVSVLLRNSTKTHIGVATGTLCPLFVRIFPDPTGEPSGSLDLSMACPSGSATVDLAPTDTLVLTRVLPADSLASFAPGNYGVNVAITTTTDVMGGWAGAILLPLGSSR